MSCKIKTNLAILVSQKYLEKKHPDDLALKEAMNKLGYSVKIIAWDNFDFDYRTCQVAIIRSCWDYDQRVNEFLQRMSVIEKQCQLFNPFTMIKENSSKLYLNKLKKKGVPVVPSFFIKSLSELNSTLLNFNFKKMVIKPTISASGRDTFRISTENKPRIIEVARSILDKQKQILLQPYMENIEVLGERSTVVIDGKPVFTMLKKPAPGNFLVHRHWGGNYHKTETTEKDRFFIKNVLKAFHTLPLYARIDYIYDNDQTPLLLELELIEPNLYLSERHPGLKMLACRLASVIEKGRQLEA